MKSSLFTEVIDTPEHSEYSLLEIICNTPDNQKLSLVIALKKSDIPDNRPMDLKKHEDNILIRKFGDLTQEDRDNAIKLFQAHYCKTEQKLNNLK